MKRKLLYLLSLVFLLTTNAYSQEDTAVGRADATVTAAAQPAAKKVVTTATPLTRVAPKPKADTIRGNAGKEVELIEASGSCANNMKSLGVTNKSATRAMKVGVEVNVAFMGRVSKKNIIIDNLAPNETRNVGCAGCIDNVSGKTCTTYKIFAAMYK